jgi:hypothetical protein
MAIKGLTHRAPSFPEVGILRKGGPKTQANRPGPDLDHFRFMPTSDDREGAAVAEAFHSAYGGEPRLVNVCLPFRSTDECFEAWNEHWVAGGLVHRCDGETCVLWRTEDGGYSREPKPCPGGCKPSGRLKVIVPELRRLAYVTVLTTSVHDVMHLDKQLRALEGLRGDLRGIPLQLRRRKVSISTPGRDGKRIRRDKWLLSIEAAPSWVDLQLAAQEEAATPQLTAGQEVEVLVVDGATGEVLDQEPEPIADDELEPEVAADTEADDGTQDQDEPEGADEPEDSAEPTQAEDPDRDDQPAENGSDSGSLRPLGAESVRSVIRVKAGWVDGKRLDSEPVTETQLQDVTALFGDVFAILDDADGALKAALGYLVGIDSIDRLTRREAAAMLAWLGDPGEERALNEWAKTEAVRVLAAADSAAGQMAMDL